MEDDTRNKGWQIVWTGVALLGLVGVLLGSYHHIATFIIGITMAIIAGRTDDDNQLKPR